MNSNLNSFRSASPHIAAGTPLPQIHAESHVQNEIHGCMTKSNGGGVTESNGGVTDFNGGVTESNGVRDGIQRCA